VARFIFEKNILNDKFFETELILFSQETNLFTKKKNFMANFFYCVHLRH